MTHLRAVNSGLLLVVERVGMGGSIGKTASVVVTSTARNVGRMLRDAWGFDR